LPLPFADGSTAAAALQSMAWPLRLLLDDVFAAQRFGRAFVDGSLP
jgi:hypothetical protein